MDVEKVNSDIMNEANKILHDKGLFPILEKLGTPLVSGSYVLRMMTWRDLDIYVESDSINQDSFFDVGKEISSCLQPSKMSFRNEFIGKTSHLPNGLYWGVHTNLFEKPWKIDIWIMGSDEVRKKQESLEKMKVQISQDTRQAILHLKSQLHTHQRYRKEFFSVDIYNAVIEDQIHTVNEFKVWLYERKGIEI